VTVSANQPNGMPSMPPASSELGKKIMKEQAGPILVTGATWNTGRAIVDALVARRVAAATFSRNAPCSVGAKPYCLDEFGTLSRSGVPDRTAGKHAI
jgi:hypothetical protein